MPSATGWYTIMDDLMVNDNTSSELQLTKPHYNGAKEAEDNDIMSSVPIKSYDSTRVQMEAIMA